MINLFSLTRERLEFTQVCFTTLQEKAGHEFRHWILDNGSKDGTVEWLGEYTAKYPNVQELILLSENVGIPKGINLLRERMRPHQKECAFVVKMDNDCLIKSETILAQIAKILAAKPRWNGEYVLSPRVEGINRQPARISQGGWAGHRLGITGIVGGLFEIFSPAVFFEYHNDENLPKAKGNDGVFAEWFTKQGGTFAYIEDLVVEHYLTTNGQAERYPEYFQRKQLEEQR